MPSSDIQTLAAFEAALIASEQSSGRKPAGTTVGELPPLLRDWLAAGHFFSFSNEATNHPEPIVANLARLQKAQRQGDIDSQVSTMESLLESIQTAGPLCLETVGTSALLSVSRVALRTGAWKLLASTLPAGLSLARQRPQKRRLSVATGLVAEWALAAGHSRIACIYATESLRHGSENQRIQGYLGFAHALAAQWDYAFLLLGNALAVQNTQEGAGDRKAFGASNLIRAYAIRSIMDRSRHHLDEAGRRFREWHSLLHSNQSSMPAVTARVALCLAHMAHHLPLDADMDLDLREILNRGRWRDLILLESFLPDLCLLESTHYAAIDRLNEINCGKLPKASLVDEGLSELPEVLTSRNTGIPEKRPLALFCI